MSEILEVNGNKYIGVLNLDCGDCDLNNKSCVIDDDERCSNLNLVWKEVKMSNNNDLSNVEVGNYIRTIKSGWSKVIWKHGTLFALDGDDTVYDSTGTNICDKYPSAWLEPPEYLNADPKPCEIKKGDMVIVGYSTNFSGNKRYFSHYEEDDDSYHCYSDGRTEWSSNGETSRWYNCKKA